MSRKFSTTCALVVAAALVLATGAAAYAQSWKLKDTDSLNRSTPSQNVYTTSGSFKWYDEDLDHPSGEVGDARATFSVRLNLDGAKNSCARLRVITYKTTGASYATSKRFPASSSTNYGYYTYCQSDGKGYKTYSGADDLAVGYTSAYNDITKADVKICYSRSTSVAPSSDCYAFTVKKGD
ncbi:MULTISPECIES: hypothetical protein [unclassified Aeromicrobium]|uniref:hypothetical protein n=1 Tax=unclassified Aeromicrobium TaxID=2633570 RepID=UPI00288A8389|nr:MULTISPECIES: hypothetical protein [unclassified Aeromicrobium]